MTKRKLATQPTTDLAVALEERPLIPTTTTLMDGVHVEILEEILGMPVATSHHRSVQAQNMINYLTTLNNAAKQINRVKSRAIVSAREAGMWNALGMDERTFWEAAGMTVAEADAHISLYVGVLKPLTTIGVDVDTALSEFDKKKLQVVATAAKGLARQAAGVQSTDGSTPTDQEIYAPLKPLIEELAVASPSAVREMLNTAQGKKEPTYIFVKWEWKRNDQGTLYLEIAPHQTLSAQQVDNLAARDTVILHSIGGEGMTWPQVQSAFNHEPVNVVSANPTEDKPDDTGGVDWGDLGF